MTGSNPADSQDDPILTEIRKARQRKLRAEQDLRTLIAYAREFARPRPYRLTDLAQAAGMSVSGVRTMYRTSDVNRVAELLHQAAPPALYDA
jgi:AraC-like DNA-binding protein